MRIILAPMEGLLDFRLREILTEIGGYDECVSEFIRVNDTLLPTHRFYRVVPELKTASKTKSNTPVKVQILGSDPICMAENACVAASLGAYGIDINFGCPAPTVNRNRGGAALLKEPELMYQIVRAVRSSVPETIPVTAKMRLGFDSTELTLDCAKALEDGGAKEIVVHARTKIDGYKPPAYWDWIFQIQASLKINVIANGEIWSVEDAFRCLDISKCQDIMIGRGAVSNPALALLIKGTIRDKFEWDQLKKILMSYWNTMEVGIEGVSKTGRIKQWLHYLSREYEEAKVDFQLIKQISHPKELETTYFSEFLSFK